MTVALPKRTEVQKEFTWDLESVFATPNDWEKGFIALEKRIAEIAAFQGKLTASPKNLLAWMTLSEDVGPQAENLVNYAFLRGDEDTTNQANQARVGRVFGLLSRVRAAGAFAEPELLAKLTDAKFAAFVAKEPKLKIYKHFFENLQRQKAHVRNGEVEALLAQAGDALNAPGNTYGMLVDADLKFAPVQDKKGATIAVAQGNVDELLSLPDRTLRKAAFNSYADGFISMKNTIAAVYTNKVKASAFNAQARGYKSTLAASLYSNNIPQKVFENVIDACNRHLPIWHKYWDVRRRALKLKKAEPCDIFAPLSKPVKVPYAEAINMVCAGMQPLGADYVDAIRAGCTSERWVDVYPNQGKRNGAYSGGGYNTRPFILMSYSDVGLGSMSTLAHELGHSMHSLLSSMNQNYTYAGYGLFVAEVASNFNQAMTRAYLLDQNKDKNFQIAVIEEAMQNFHRYLFLMPILAQWERHVHSQIEKGGALGADDMSGYLADLFKKGYGDAMTVDDARVGITWAQFSHFYSDFYVYQYASGIAAANALADGILQSNGKARETAVNKYLNMLSSGGSKYALDTLKLAGIDMTKPEPMDRAFGVLEGFVNRLEKLVG